MCGVCTIGLHCVWCMYYRTALWWCMYYRTALCVVYVLGLHCVVCGLSTSLSCAVPCGQPLSDCRKINFLIGYIMSFLLCVCVCAPSL